MHTKNLLESAGISLADLDAVVIGGGPGSYTGLRVAASAVKGMLFGTDVPLFMGNTLAGFALGLDGLDDVDATDDQGNSAGPVETGGQDGREGLYQSRRVHSMIDARRKHVYHQLFKVQTIAEEVVDSGRTGPDRKGVVLHVAEGAEADGIVALSDASIIEIKDLYGLFRPGDVLVGTGIERLDQDYFKGLQIFNIEQTSAVGLIRLLDLGTSSINAHIVPSHIDPSQMDPANIDPASIDPSLKHPASTDPALNNPAPSNPTSNNSASTDPLLIQKVDPAEFEPIYTVTESNG